MNNDAEWFGESKADAVARQDDEFPVCGDCGERRGMDCDGHEDEAVRS